MCCLHQEEYTDDNLLVRLKEMAVDDSPAVSTAVTSSTTTTASTSSTTTTTTRTASDLIMMETESMEVQTTAPAQVQLNTHFFLSELVYEKAALKNKVQG